VFSASPSLKHEDEREAGHKTKEMQENDSLVSADPGNTNIITIAARKCREDGIDGNLRHKDMRLLKFSRARYYRESGIMNWRRKNEKWNAGVREQLEAISQVTSHGADFKAYLEFIETQAAHYEELRKEYTKPPRARLLMNLYCG